MIKDPKELKIIEEACALADYAVELGVVKSGKVKRS